ncbi:XRE family transcriptional regulator [Lacticaseibacillus paracasei]|uniref:helix-turn-helix domain-containing protein n=1 Tax=Lacticaseibacillus paracasei TaxID=1597 RepID=UPI000FEFA593|nr:helix-turn-helix transcriptional regulator [Lacticaseibacillus paracasei]RWZ62502.1 XRE family transcriptional regulator [Lacticaseibacillus paracasei]
MLKFNLSQLMSDAHMSISALSEKTGISRKTLSQIANNDSKGIQLATLDAIIKALNTKVENVIIKDETRAIVAFTSIETVRGMTENVSDDVNDLSIGIYAQLCDMSGENKENASYFGAALSISLTKTPKGNIMGYVFPAFTADELDPKLRGLVDHSNKFMDFIRDCTDEESERLTSNILSTALILLGNHHRNLSGIDRRSTAIVTWSKDGEKPVNLSLVSGNSFFPPDKHVTNKLSSSHSISILNVNLTDWIQPFLK